MPAQKNFYHKEHTMIYKAFIFLFIFGLFSTTKSNIKTTETEPKVVVPKESNRDKLIVYAREYLGINYKYASSNP